MGYSTGYIPFSRPLTLALICWIMPLVLLQAQYPVKWDRTIGGENYEELNGLRVLDDGVIIGGSSRSNLTFGDPADPSWNILVFKLDLSGNLLWLHTYGGAQDERLWMLIQTADGGFLCGGYSYSDVSGDKTEPSRGDMDVWIIRLDASGNLLWDKTFGGSGRDELFSALEMPDGGFLLGCHSNSGISGDKSEDSRGGQDFWLIRTNAQGGLVWEKTIGGDNYDQVQDLAWAADGMVYISGGTFSTPGSGEIAVDSARGGLDFWLAKFDPFSKQLIWNHRYGGGGEDFPYALCLSRDGKIYLGGRSASQPSQPTVFNNGKNSAFWGGHSDFWLLQLDPNGQKINDWSFGGSGLDDLYFIQENKRSDLVLGGVSDSGPSGNKTSPGHGGFDFWLLTFNPAAGAIKAQQTFGGSGNDAPTQIGIFADGALVFGGHSDSPADFEKSEPSAGVNDFWVVATDCETSVDIVENEPQLPCAGLPLTLSAQTEGCDSCFFLWSDGTTLMETEVPVGTNEWYSVMVIDAWGCMAADSIWVQTIPPLQFNLGPSDTLLMAGATLMLGQGNPNWHYQWSTGSMAPVIAVQNAGVYAVTVTDPETGCTASDSINIQYLENHAVWVPNVFTPNDDGLHDVVGIFTSESVRIVVTFQIYDRWGELCYRRDDFLPQHPEYEGWDGYFRGKLMKPDVFTWVAIVEFVGGMQEFHKGTITIVR